MKHLPELTKYDRERLEAVKELIEKDVSRHYSLPYLAAYAGLNRHKLTYGFKQEYKKSIYSFLKDKRLLAAQELLAARELSIKQIAAFCGFKNPHNFSTSFKKQVGVSPREYQRRNAV